MKKFILVALLVLCMTGVAMANDSILVMVNGKLLNSDAVMINDRVFVPLRAVGEAFGAKVEWDGSKAIVNTLGRPVITGDASQKAKVEAALQLLQEKDPADYELVCRYVNKILVDNYSSNDTLAYSMIPVKIIPGTAIPDTIFLKQVLFDKYDNIHIAATLVHESTHLCNAYNDNIRSNNKIDENIAYLREIAVLRILGASQSIIDGTEATRLRVAK